MFTTFSYFLAIFYIACFLAWLVYIGKFLVVISPIIITFLFMAYFPVIFSYIVLTIFLTLMFSGFDLEVLFPMSDDMPTAYKVTAFCFKIRRIFRDFKAIKSKPQFVEWLAYTALDLDIDKKVFDTLVADTVSFVPFDTGDDIDNIRNYIDNFGDLLDSKLGEKLRKLFFGIMCAGMAKSYGLTFTNLGYDELEEERLRRKYTIPKNIFGVHFIADSVVFFVETGYKFFTTGDLRESLIHDDDISKFFKDYDTFKKAAFSDTAKDVRKLIAFGEDLIKRGRRLKGGFATSLISRAVSAIENTIEKKRNSFNATKNRRPPFPVLIYGPPGIGKSTITDYVIAIYYLVTGKKYDKTKDRYNRNPADEYWSGYDSHKVTVVDDISQEGADQVKAGKAASLNDLIKCLNVVGFATTQADLEDKGKIPFVSELFIGTTNIKDLNARLFAAEPAAVRRRFPIIVCPVLKPQYRKEGTSQMKALDKIVLNAWDYKIIEIGVVVTSDNKTKVIENNVIVDGSDTLSGEQFFEYMREKILQHERNCDIMEQAADRELELCDHGFYAPICSSCSFEPMDLSEDIQYNVFWRLTGLWSFYIKWLVRCKLFCFHYKLFPQHFTSSDVNFYLTAKKNSCRIVTTMAAIAGILATGYIFLKFTEAQLYDDEEEQSKNIWAKDSDDYVDVMHQSKTISSEDLTTKIKRRNLFRMGISTGDESFRSINAVGVYGRCYMTNAHAFDNGDVFKIVLSRGDTEQPLVNQQMCLLEKKDIHFVEGKDVCFFSSPNLKLVPDIRHFFPKEDKLGKTQCSLVEPNGNVQEITAYRSPVSIRYNRLGHSYATNIMAWAKAKKGVCGAVAIAHTPMQNYIRGILSCGNNMGQVGFMSVLYDDIPNMESLDGGDYSYIRENNPLGNVVKLHPNSRLRHESLKGRAIPMCSFDGRRKNPKSRTVDSSIRSKVEKEFNYTVKHAPPPMRGEMVNGEYRDPYLISVKKQSQIGAGFLQSDVDECVSAYAADLIEGFDLTKIYPVSKDVALNGEEGNSYCNKLDRSTSGGYRWPGAKRNQLEMVDDKYVMSEEVEHYVDLIYAKWCKGERVNIMVDGCLKDEALPKAKCEAYKTRMFTGSSMDVSINMRRLTVKVAEQFMIKNFVSECMAGINCYRDWNKLRAYLIYFHILKIVAGDYETFDKGMFAQMIAAAFKVIRKVCDASGNYSNEELLAIDTMGEEFAHPLVNVNGDLVEFNGGNSSGHPLTVIINSIVNSLYIRLAFKNVTDKHVSEFKKFVHLATLGDDNAMGVSPLIEFSHTQIQNYLGKYGVKYTMPDKETESIPYVSIEDIEFLKRRFVEKDGEVYCPLNEDSIMKSMCVLTKSKSVLENEQLAQILEAANREFAMYGKEVYDVKHAKLLKIIESEPSISRMMLPRFYESWEYQMSVLRGDVVEENPSGDLSGFEPFSLEEQMYNDFMANIRRRREPHIPFIPEQRFRDAAFIANNFLLWFARWLFSSGILSYFYGFFWIINFLQIVYVLRKPVVMMTERERDAIIERTVNDIPLAMWWLKVVVITDSAFFVVAFMCSRFEAFSFDEPRPEPLFYVDDNVSEAEMFEDDEESFPDLEMEYESDYDFEYEESEDECYVDVADLSDIELVEHFRTMPLDEIDDYITILVREAMDRLDDLSEEEREEMDEIVGSIGSRNEENIRFMPLDEDEEDSHMSIFMGDDTAQEEVEEIDDDEGDNHASIFMGDDIAHVVPWADSSDDLPDLEDIPGYSQTDDIAHVDPVVETIPIVNILPWAELSDNLPDLDDIPEYSQTYDSDIDSLDMYWCCSYDSESLHSDDSE
jgi:hypothetical protein